MHFSLSSYGKRTRPSAVSIDELPRIKKANPSKRIAYSIYFPQERCLHKQPYHKTRKTINHDYECLNYAAESLPKYPARGRKRRANGSGNSDVNRQRMCTSNETLDSVMLDATKANPRARKDTYTLDKLKAECEKHGLCDNGRKADIVDRIQTHYAERHNIVRVIN